MAKGSQSLTEYYITTPKFEKLRMEIKLKMLVRALEEELLEFSK